MFMVHAAARIPEAIVFAEQRINTNFIEMISYCRNCGK
jgi:hypothetical protein